MLFLTGIFDDIRAFLSSGGTVLWVVLGATTLLWILIVEKYAYIRTVYPKKVKELCEYWDRREDKRSWNSLRIREAKLSLTIQELAKGISFIKVLVAVCPLLGLLGTVTGMISVFEVMAMLGTGNPRLMAGGIAMATIPTMAGMVAALSGVYFGSRLESRVKVEKEKLADLLPYQL